jgi:hypothetical protein
MPMFRGGRPLKRWRWVGAFADDVMVCAAVAKVGPVPLSWWAIWDRGQRTLAERTSRGRPAVTFSPGRVLVEDGPARIDLAIEETDGVETVSPHGSQYIWTRKQGGIAVRGTVEIGDRRHAIDARGIVDDSAGYHARRTSWHWSAGVGESSSGAAVAWNLVTGLHDDPAESERTVWVDGTPHHVEPLRFDGIQRVGDLRFTAEATRTHAENRLVFASSYEQPFGTFEGDLPVAGRVTGMGVMERHDVTW